MEVPLLICRCWATRFRAEEAFIIAPDGNPLQDITAVGRVVFVMKGGKVDKNLVTVRKAATASSAGAPGR